MSTVACSLLLLSLGSQTPAPPPDPDDLLVRRLVAALKDPDPEVRQNLAAALAKIGPASVEPLIGALKDTLPEQRAGAAYTLALLGPAARSALPALLDALGDTQVEVRRNVSLAISRVVVPARPTLRQPTRPVPVVPLLPVGGK